MILNHENKMTVHQRRHLSYIIAIQLILIFTGLFWLFDLDLIIQSKFYKNGYWYLSEYFIFSFLYKYGNLPALITVLVSLSIWILSYSKQNLLQHRSKAIYLILVMILGPGILVNAILKDQWGRPRPRDLLEFGGYEKYEKPLEMDRSSNGKSFPCGHASMGFYFFSLGMIIKGKKRFLVYAISWILGSAIGLARIAQGGHFLSDVGWAAFIVYIAAYLLYQYVKPNKPLNENASMPRKLGKLAKISLVLLGSAVTIGILMATPYHRKHNPSLEKICKNVNSYELLFNADKVNLNIAYSDSSSLLAFSQGFGFPGSKLSYKPSLRYINGRYVLSIKQLRRGHFTELSSNVTLVIDSTKCSKISIQGKQLKGQAEIGSHINMCINADHLEFDVWDRQDKGYMPIASREIRILDNGHSSLVDSLSRFIGKRGYILIVDNNMKKMSANR